MGIDQTTIDNHQSPTQTDGELMRNIVAALVTKMGGAVTLTQDDFNATAHKYLLDRVDAEGMHFRVAEANEAYALLGMQVPPSMNN